MLIGRLLPVGWGWTELQNENAVVETTLMHVLVGAALAEKPIAIVLLACAVIC